MFARQRSAPPPVYQDFQPKLESKDEPETHLLLIHLPGFKREQINAKYESSFRRVKVFGERQVGADNQWSRFDVSYSVPESCDTSKLQRKFDNGIVTIIMPKKIIPKVAAPKEEPKPTEEAKPPQPAAQPKAEKTDQEAAPPKAAEMAQKSQEGNSQEPKPTEQAEPPQPAAQPKAEKTDQEVVPPKAVEMAQKSHEGTSQEPKSALDSKKQDDEKKNAYSVLPKAKSDSFSQKGQDGTSQEPVTPPKVASESMAQKGPEGIPQKAALSADAKVQTEEKGETTTPSLESDEKQKVTNGKSDGGVDQDNRKDRNDDSKVKGIKEVAASASQAMTRLAKRFKEDDKQMMIYVGAAAVVAIAALGVYASYKYRTGRSQ